MLVYLLDISREKRERLWELKRKYTRVCVRKAKKGLGGCPQATQHTLVGGEGEQANH